MDANSEYKSRVHLPEDHRLSAATPDSVMQCRLALCVRHSVEMRSIRKVQVQRLWGMQVVNIHIYNSLRLAVRYKVTAFALIGVSIPMT